MKLVSWNVNGLRACLGKGFLDFCAFADADVICLQETKMRPEQAEFDLPGYERYWNSADKAGYSGTAVFTRQTPLSVTYDFGKEVHRHEGRVITAEYPEFYLVCCYTPNSKDQLSRLDYRMEWEDDLRDYLMELDQTKPVVYCGDLNVAHQEIDRRVLLVELSLQCPEEQRRMAHRLFYRLRPAEGQDQKCRHLERGHGQ